MKSLCVCRYQELGFLTESGDINKDMFAYSDFLNYDTDNLFDGSVDENDNVKENSTEYDTEAAIEEYDIDLYASGDRAGADPVFLKKLSVGKF